MKPTNDLRADVEKAAEHLAENLQETATQVMGQVKGQVSQLGENATHLSADAARVASDLRRNMRSNATTAKESASDSLITAAESIRAEALKSGNEEVVRQSQALARSMEKAALYLDSRTVDQLGDDAKGAVRDNVWPTVGLVAFIGFLLGLLLGGGRRRS